MRILYIKNADNTYTSSKSFFGTGYKEYTICLAPDQLSGKIINARTYEVVATVPQATSHHKLKIKIKKELKKLGVDVGTKETRAKRKDDNT